MADDRLVSFVGPTQSITVGTGTATTAPSRRRRPPSLMTTTFRRAPPPP